MVENNHYHAVQVFLSKVGKTSHARAYYISWKRNREAFL